MAGLDLNKNCGVSAAWDGEGRLRGYCSASDVPVKLVRLITVVAMIFRPLLLVSWWPTSF